MAHAQTTKASALEMTEQELQSLRLRFQPGVVLSAEDCDLIQALVVTLEQITQQLGQKKASIARLRVLLFGPHTEKTKDVLRGANPPASPPPGSTSGAGDPSSTSPGSSSPPPPPT